MKEIKPRIKPIIPAAQTPPAEELERSYQEAMRRISGETAPELAEEPEKLPAKKAKTPAKPTTKGRPKNAQKREPGQPNGANRPGKHRLTLDLPDDLFELAEAHKVENGQSFTWLVTKLLRDFFAKKGG